MAYSFKKSEFLAPAALVVAVAMSGCTDVAVESQNEVNAPQYANPLHLKSEVVWAINVGGDAYQGIDGVAYQADPLSTGSVGHIEKILGSQDSPLFQSYRHGDVEIHQPVANGTYDVLFKFAEPEDKPVGSRVFDVYAEEQVVLKNLDVRLARDGNHHSSLTRAATGIEVKDGMLDIRFKASKGEPILNAVVVRKQSNDEQHWQLVWQDEFDYEGKLDPNKWVYDVWSARKVNDEDQAYTDRLENVEVKDGKLTITALKEDFDDAKYTSGRVHTQGKKDILYGRIDVRAKLPKGQGTWAAIWMLPSDPFAYATKCGAGTDWQGNPNCDAWPNSGEIDIMEHVGYEMDVIHGTVHNKAYYWVNWEQRKASIQANNVDTEFHDYSLEWSPQHISVLYDGVPYFYYANENNGWESWPFDKAHHLILNLAIGGYWGRAGGPIDDTIFPAKMEVDYVRVYESIND